MFDKNFQIIAIVLFIALFVVGFILLLKLFRYYEARWSSAKDDFSSGYKRKRTLEARLKQSLQYVDNHEILTVEDQRIINAVLQQPPEDNLIEYVRGENWQYGSFANTVGTYTSFYSFDLTGYSFEILMRRAGYGSTALRFFTRIIESGKLLYVEGVIDKDYDIFAPKGLSIEAMSVLSPEVLEVLRHSPKNATLLIKRNTLFYIVYGASKLEADYDAFKFHAKSAVRELDDNLIRFAAGTANREIVKHAKDTPVGISDEEYYTQPEGSYVTKF